MSAPSVSAALTALAALAIPLALTEAVELGFAAAVRRTGRGLGAVALVNVLTNPPVNALYALTTAVAGLPAVPAAAVLEAAAVAAEGAVYRAWGGFRRPFLFSLCANALSFSAGLAFSAALKLFS